MAKEDIEVKIIDHRTGQTHTLEHMKNVLLVGCVNPQIQENGTYKVYMGKSNKHDELRLALALLNRDNEGMDSLKAAFMVAMMMQKDKDYIAQEATTFGVKHETPDIGGPIGDFLREMGEDG